MLKTFMEDEKLEIENEEALEESITNEINVYVARAKVALRMRANPSTDSEVIRILYVGEMVSVIDDPTIADWVQVVLGNVEGYCIREFLERVDNE